MPNTVSYTHTHTHDYYSTGADDRCDCGSTPADTALRNKYGILVVQVPGIDIWTITRNGEPTNAMFPLYNAAMHSANNRAREAAAAAAAAADTHVTGKLDTLASAVEALQAALTDALDDDTITWAHVTDHIDVSKPALEEILAAVNP
jgi:hypothetical protein